MDYSLLVGIHDCDVATANGSGDQPRNNSFDNDLDDTAEGEGDDPEDEDSPGSGAGGGGELTPPDSPVVIEQAPFFSGELDQSLEFYAVKCSESMSSDILIFYLFFIFCLLWQKYVI